MSAHTSLHSLAAAQARDAFDADERRLQTWTACVAALLLGLVAGALAGR